MVGQKKKVVELVQPAKEINQGCVNILREALARAKAGEVYGCAICLAIKDPDSDSGRGSIHLSTWDAAYKDTLYTGVGAMEFGMKHSMWDSAQTVEKRELTPEDE
jgi:hypothetical protein